MKIIEYANIDVLRYHHVLYIRVEPGDLTTTIQDIITALSDMSWIAQFDQQYIRNSFKKKAGDTAKYLSKQLQSQCKDNVTSNTGEYVVSELAREAIVKQLQYLDVPLAELFKEQVIGNPGFDFYSANKQDIIIFGEAKYKADRNAYGNAMEQVDRFIQEEQDVSDITDIDRFFTEAMLDNADNGEKAYAIAFSSKETKSEDIIRGIMNNKHYAALVGHKELIFIAVNI